MNIKWKYNSNYFKPVNGKLDEKQAYIFGWIEADGCVYHSHNSHFLELTLKNTQSNRKILDFIANELCIGGKRLYEGRTRDTIGLVIHNKTIVHDLETLGCVQRKTKILKPPWVEMNRKAFFKYLLGYMEADGCVTYANCGMGKPLLSISIAGTREICEWLKDRVTVYCGMRKGFIYKYPRLSNLCSLVYLGKAAELVREFMYQNSFCWHEEKRRKAYASLRGEKSGLFSYKDIKRVVGIPSWDVNYYIKAKLLHPVQIDRKKFYKVKEILSCLNYISERKAKVILGVSQRMVQKIAQEYNIPWVKRGRCKLYDKFVIENLFLK